MQTVWFIRIHRSHLSFTKRPKACKVQIIVIPLRTRAQRLYYSTRIIFIFMKSNAHLTYLVGRSSKQNGWTARFHRGMSQLNWVRMVQICSVKMRKRETTVLFGSTTHNDYFIYLKVILHWFYGRNRTIFSEWPENLFKSNTNRLLDWCIIAMSRPYGHDSCR